MYYSCGCCVYDILWSGDRVILCITRVAVVWLLCVWRVMEW